MGTSHPNLIHHFGSAAALRHELRSQIVEELNFAATSLMQAHARGEKTGESVIERVFHVYSKGGLARLLAWEALSGENPLSPASNMALEALVDALSSTRKDGAATKSAREVVSLVMALAFAASLIGPLFPGYDLDGDQGLTALTRKLSAALLEGSREGEEPSRQDRQSA